MEKNLLGKRMKEYEAVSKGYLIKRTPVIIRVDGKAFHSFTKNFAKPFDEVLMKTMQDTMLFLCKNIQGCVFGYTQSDEITLVLVDYKEINTMPWFENNVQKMCSITASMATLEFNRKFGENYDEYYYEHKDMDESLLNAYGASWHTGAMFDARAFNIPEDEVCNNLIWRQQDATRNSINMVARSFFSHKSIQGLSSKRIQEKLFQEKQVNWNDYPVHQKRGSCCVKRDVELTDSKGRPLVRKKWFIDMEPPIFSQNRDYIENLINERNY